MSEHLHSSHASSSARSTAACAPLFLISETTDPFANIAMEEALMDVVRPGELLLFLWQNADTIVIGRNQNPWNECRVTEFEHDGGKIARRLSGGGAVYHDVGNLNFTFIACEEDYDFDRNMQVICKAVCSFGLDAELSGRNDVTVEGAKFSGNAFFRTNGRQCHHGTLMIDVDTGKLASYLQPDPKKLAAKGIDSVRSRVVNLASLCSRINVETLSIAFIESLAEACKANAEPFPVDRLEKDDLVRRTARFASLDWRLGHTRPFTHELEQRFVWGNLDIALFVKNAVIENARICSDALDAAFIGRLADALEGCPYEPDAIESRLRAVSNETTEQQTMSSDCIALLRTGF